MHQLQDVRNCLHRVQRFRQLEKNAEGAYF